MNAIDKFLMHVNETVQDNPEKGWNEMVFGFRLNKLRTRILPKRHIAKGYQRLEKVVMTHVSSCLGKEDEYVWSNIFAPVEIMQCFGLKSLSVETIAGLLTGYKLENYFIDTAEHCGIAPTLCSFHKGFIGAYEAGAIHAPGYSITTSLSCDGNLNTFRYMEKRAGVPFSFIDIPAKQDEEAVLYVKQQLINLSKELEKKTGKSFDEEKLRFILEIENETRGYMKEFFALQGEHWYPAELISPMFLFMASHLLIGTVEFRDLIKFMVEDIKTYPKLEGKCLLWGHVVPFYQDTLNNIFQGSREYQIVASDIVLDYLEQMDTTDPFGALARKLVYNIYNLPYEKKTEEMVKLAKTINADGMIYFCHWGCKQVSGGGILMKEAMRKAGIPTLILDGDAMDSRNNQDGQIKTRLEAFFELIDSGEIK